MADIGELWPAIIWKIDGEPKECVDLREEIYGKMLKAWAVATTPFDELWEREELRRDVAIFYQQRIEGI